jgi:hypothetical protein
MSPTLLSILLSLTEAAAHLAQVLALALGGVWTYRRFIRQREDHARLDLTADLQFIGVQGDQHLAVVELAVTNDGVVRHRIQDLRFSLRTTRAEASLVRGDEAILGQVLFPAVHYRDQRMFPKSWVWSFVEPKATNRYRFAVLIPRTASFALVKAYVLLPGEDEFFSSLKILAIPATPAAAPPVLTALDLG